MSRRYICRGLFIDMMQISIPFQWNQYDRIIVPKQSSNINAKNSLDRFLKLTSGNVCDKAVHQDVHVHLLQV